MKAGARPFHADLRFGRATEMSPRVWKALKRLYPRGKVVRATPREDGQGVDLWILKPSGSRVGVQVKGRRTTFWGDVFLEVQADAEKGTPGWALDPEAEILVVVYTDRVLLFHMPTLALLVRENLDRWISSGYGHTTTSEKRPGQIYRSFGLFVPVHELAPALLLTAPRDKTGDAA